MLRNPNCLKQVPEGGQTAVVQGRSDESSYRYIKEVVSQEVGGRRCRPGWMSLSIIERAEKGSNCERIYVKMNQQ